MLEKLIEGTSCWLLNTLIKTQLGSAEAIFDAGMS